MSIDNGEVKYYQPRFAKWIQSAKWDSIAERLSETSMSLITQVMNAEKDGDFARADEIRDELLAKGIVLEDTREGVKWKKA